jgi:oxygen-independent coproporphyrinogen-3 oxidase
MELISLYIHIPFCKHRCAYCDFNTYAGMENLIPAYVKTLCREVQWVAQAAGKKLPVHTVYMGGGTPSLLSLDEIERIFCVIRSNFDLKDDAEISLEANPGTLSEQCLQGLFALGVNRISIGMQSAHQVELCILERIHDYMDVVHSVEWVRRAGIHNINLDLIFGIPGQNLDGWKRSLELAIRLRPEHLSMYSLTLEEGTQMERWVSRGLLAEMDSDLAADMYDLADEFLDQAGYQQYEISNWAKPGSNGHPMACRHNLQYWRGKPYLGLGAGAHGYVNHIRTANVLTPKGFIDRMVMGIEPKGTEFPCTPATVEISTLNPDDEMGELMMMGLRLTQEGVPEETFIERFGKTLEEVYGTKIQYLEKSGLLEWLDLPKRSLRLTKRGRLLGNQVFREFI